MSAVTFKFFKNGFSIDSASNNDFFDFAWSKDFKFGDHFKAEIKAAIENGSDLKSIRLLLADLVECFLNSENK